MPHNAWYAILIFTIFSSGLRAQDLKTERGINQALLKVIKGDIEEKYLDTASYSPKIEESYERANELIGKSSSTNEMERIIALFIVELNDSRIFFVPRVTNVDVDYQWSLNLIGGRVFITDLDVKSDAYAKGLRAGDQIYSVDDYILSRESFWKMKYVYDVISPQGLLKLIIVKPSGHKYAVEVKSKVVVSNVLEDASLTSNRNHVIPDETTFKEKSNTRFYEKIEGLIICRLPTFFTQPFSVKRLIEKAKNNALILDLRGADGIDEKIWELRIRLNRKTWSYLPPEFDERTIDHDDGDLETLKRLAAFFFGAGLKIGELRGKKNSDRLTAGPQLDGKFTGRLVVLVDSETSGAAEVFARLVQTQNLGTVVGDLTAGRFVKSEFLTHASWVTFGSPFGLQVPVAEIVMNGNERLNGKGVVPDQVVLPSPTDVQKLQDPVIARAAGILGFKITLEDTGAILASLK